MLHVFAQNLDADLFAMQKDPGIKPLFVIGGDHHLHQHQYGNHLNGEGAPERVQAGLDALLSGYLYASTYHVPFIVNGDLTHNKNSLDPVVTWHLYALFKSLLTTGSAMAVPGEKLIVPTYLVVGNHERPEKYKTTHTLRVFEDVVERVISEPEVVQFDGIEVGFLPFFYDHLGAIAKLEAIERFGNVGILVGHYPTSGANLGSYTLESPVNIGDFHPEKWNAVLLNDIHKHQPIGTNGYHLGATMQNNFGDDMDTGWWLCCRNHQGDIFLYRLPISTACFMYCDTPEEAEVRRQQGHYARVKPERIIADTMAEQDQARLDFDMQDMRSTISTYLKFQSEAGKIPRTDVVEIQSRAMKALGLTGGAR